jgi:hypothetical protein
MVVEFRLRRAQAARRINAEPSITSAFAIFESVPPVEHSMTRAWSFMVLEEQERGREILLAARSCQISTSKFTVSGSNLHNRLNRVKAVCKRLDLRATKWKQKRLKPCINVYKWKRLEFSAACVHGRHTDPRARSVKLL